MPHSHQQSEAVLWPFVLWPEAGQVKAAHQPLTAWRAGPHHHFEILPHEGGEALAQAAQRSCGCPLPGSAQVQGGWSSEHPGLVEDVPAHGRGAGTRCSSRSLPTQTILRFYDLHVFGTPRGMGTHHCPGQPVTEPQHCRCALDDTAVPRSFPGSHWTAWPRRSPGHEAGLQRPRRARLHSTTRTAPAKRPNRAPSSSHPPVLVQLFRTEARISHQVIYLIMNFHLNPDDPPTPDKDQMATKGNSARGGTIPRLNLGEGIFHKGI